MVHLLLQGFSVSPPVQWRCLANNELGYKWNLFVIAFCNSRYITVKKKCCCDQKYAVSVECCTQGCYCELVRNVVYNSFQDILVPGGDTVLWGIQEIPQEHLHFNCSFMQLKQQTSGHNISLWECIIGWTLKMQIVMPFWNFEYTKALTLHCGISGRW